MRKIFLGASWLSSAIIVTHLLLSSNALIAQEAIDRADSDRTIEFPDESANSLEQDPLDSVSSVSQLSDVQATDWAFSALQSLIERYGVIAGYPDGTFRGNRAMTRYEFAAALNAALERINQLINAGEGERVREEDLQKLQRLQADFTPELTYVQTQIDSLEGRTAFLEANQFSTTTKLNGIITLNTVAARAAGDVKVERIDPKDVFSAARRGADGKPIVTKVVDDANITFSHVTGLFLTTSFTGKDSLVTTLAAGNGNSPANVYTSAGLYNTFGVPGPDFTPTTIPNRVTVLETFYSFPATNSLQVVVGPRLFWLRYFDTNAFTKVFGKGASGFNTYGSTLVQEPGRGGGAIAIWRFNEKLNLRLGYVASFDASNPATGLFNGTRAFTTQLTYSPIPEINLRLLYDRSRIPPVNGQIRTKPIQGVADDGFGGAIEDATANSFVFNFDWLVKPNFGIFGRYSYASTHLNAATNGVSDGNVRAQAFQIGVAFPDLGKRGALATLSYVIPFDVLQGRRYLVSGGGDGGTQYDIEATYYFPLTTNIAIIPAFYITGNPNNFADNPIVFSGSVLTQFSF